MLAVPGHRDEEGFEAEARQGHAGDEQHGHPAPQTARVWRQAAGESGEGQSHRHVPASCRNAIAVRDAITRRATRSSARVTTLSRDSVDLRVVAALSAHGPCGGGVIGCAPRADEVRVGPQGAGGRVRSRSGRRSVTAPEPLVVWVGLPCRGAPAGPEGPEPRRTVPSHPPILRPYRAGARDSVRLGPCAPGTGTIPWVERNGPFAPTSGSRLSNPWRRSRCLRGPLPGPPPAGSSCEPVIVDGLERWFESLRGSWPAPCEMSRQERGPLPERCLQAPARPGRAHSQHRTKRSARSLAPAWRRQLQPQRNKGDSTP